MSCMLFSTSGPALRLELNNCACWLNCGLHTAWMFTLSNVSEVSVNKYNTNVVVVVLVQCFAALHQIHSVRRSLSWHALLTLARTLIVSKVDYCNSVLADTPGQLQDQLQSVLNAAARLVYSARRSECITPLLRELHWLRVPERVTFRLCVLAYRCLYETAPAY